MSNRRYIKTPRDRAFEEISKLRAIDDRKKAIQSSDIPDISFADALWQPLKMSLTTTFGGLPEFMGGSGEFMTPVLGAGFSAAKEGIEFLGDASIPKYARTVEYQKHAGVRDPKQLENPFQFLIDPLNELAKDYSARASLHSDFLEKDSDFMAWANWKQQQPLNAWNVFDPNQIANAVGQGLASMGVGGIAALGTFAATKNPVAATRAFGYVAGMMEGIGEFRETYDYYISPREEGGLGMDEEDARDVSTKTGLTYLVASYFLEKGPIKGITNRYRNKVLEGRLKKKLFNKTNKYTMDYVTRLDKKFPGIYEHINRSKESSNWKRFIWDDLTIGSASEGATEGLQTISQSLIQAGFRDTVEPTTFTERLAQFFDSQELIESVYGGAIFGGGLSGTTGGIGFAKARREGLDYGGPDLRRKVLERIAEDENIGDQDFAIAENTIKNQDDYILSLVNENFSIEGIGEATRSDTNRDFELSATEMEKESPLGKIIIGDKNKTTTKKLYNLWEKNGKNYDFLNNLPDDAQSIVKDLIGEEVKSNLKNKIRNKKSRKNLNVSFDQSSDLNNKIDSLPNEIIEQALEDGNADIINKYLEDVNLSLDNAQKRQLDNVIGVDPSGKVVTEVDINKNISDATNKAINEAVNKMTPAEFKKELKITPNMEAINQLTSENLTALVNSAKALKDLNLDMDGNQVLNTKANVQRIYEALIPKSKRTISNRQVTANQSFVASGDTEIASGKIQAEIQELLKDPVFNSGIGSEIKAQFNDPMNNITDSEAKAEAFKQQLLDFIDKYKGQATGSGLDQLKQDALDAAKDTRRPEEVFDEMVTIPGHMDTMGQPETMTRVEAEKRLKQLEEGTSITGEEGSQDAAITADEIKALRKGLKTSPPANEGAVKQIQNEINDIDIQLKKDLSNKERSKLEKEKDGLEQMKADASEEGSKIDLERLGVETGVDTGLNENLDKDKKEVVDEILNSICKGKGK